MATFKINKVVSSLPGTLDADTIYLVRVGAGFDQYVTNTSGTIVAYKLNSPGVNTLALDGLTGTADTVPYFTGAGALALGPLTSFGRQLTGVADASATKTLLSLNNVTNTSDANKPVSTAQQTALDLKANLAGPTFTGTVSGITKTMVGLSNVDNTTDTAKPVSTAQQTALDLKVTNPMTTSGDTIYGGTSGVPTRLAKGTDGQVLKLVAGLPSWASLATVAGTGAYSDLSGPPPQANDLWMFLGGLPAANTLVLKLVFGRAVTFPANFSGSKLHASVAFTASKVFDIRKNGSSVGSCTVAAAGTTATFTSTGGAAVNFAIGDRIEITTPATQDTTGADVSITLLGTRD